VALQGERFIIERNGKAMAALINLNELEKIENLRMDDEKKGLLAAVGAWEDYPRLEQLVADLYVLREKAKERRVKRMR
jgi:hypothetical protein